VSAKEYISELFHLRTAQRISASLKGPERTFSIIAEAHLRLAKTNGVFSCTNPVEFFELVLGHTLRCREQLWFCDSNVGLCEVLPLHGRT